jgi:hypothetical protein
MQELQTRLWTPVKQIDVHTNVFFTENKETILEQQQREACFILQQMLILNNQETMMFCLTTIINPALKEDAGFSKTLCFSHPPCF